MDSKPTFKIDLTEDKSKPLPYTLGKSKAEKIKQIEHYPKFELEFFDVVKDCAKYIDRLGDVEQRIKYTKRLNKIFVVRDRMLVMILFRELVSKPVKDMKGGE